MVKKYIKTTVNMALFLAKDQNFCLWRWALGRLHVSVMVRWKEACLNLEESCNTSNVAYYGHGEARRLMGVEMIHVYILFLVEEIIHKKMKTLHYAQICIIYPNISIMFQKKSTFQNKC